MRLPLLLLAGALAADAAAQNRLYTFDGDGPTDLFGWSVSGAGDVDGDGVPDVIVGAHEPSPPDTDPGYARVFSGAGGDVLLDLVGTEAGAWFGVSVSDYADVNADGHADVLVGSPSRDSTGVDAGRAYVLSGLNGAELMRIDGDDAGDFLGRAVSGAGDVDGDGQPDFVVGAPGDDDNGAGSGSARVYSAGGALIHRFDGDAAGDGFGYSVSGAGDVNGDGFADVIVGARQYPGGNGYARVFSGADGTELFTMLGVEPDDQFGHSVSDAGDVNGDGFADVVVGAPGADPLDKGFAEPGSVTVFAGPDGAVLHLIGGILDDAFGTSVTGLGDVDGDGFDDFASGTRHDELVLHTGSADLFSGLTGELIYKVFGDGEDNFFGAAVSGLGDVNGDGTPDFVAGAFREDASGEASGRAAVFSGACLAPIPYCTSAPNSAGPGAVMTWFGSYAHADNALTLMVTGASVQQFGVFFYGRRTDETPFGDGFLCLDPDPIGVFRLSPPVMTDGGGGAVRLLDLTEPPANGGDGHIGPSSEWHFQFWYRDPAAGGSGFNLSNGLSVTFCP